MRIKNASWLRTPKVWLFTIVYFGYTSANIVVAFFLPQMDRALGANMQTTALVSAIPFVFGLGAMLFFSLRSDRSGSRTLYAVCSLLVASAGLFVCSRVGAGHTNLMMIALIVGVMGVQSFAPCSGRFRRQC